MVAASITVLKKHLFDYIRYVIENDMKVIVFNEKTKEILVELVKADNR